MSITIHFNIRAKFAWKESICTHFHQIHFPYDSDNRLKLVNIKRKGCVGKDYDILYRVTVEVEDELSDNPNVPTAEELARLLSDNTFAVCGNCKNASRVSGSLNLRYCPHCHSVGKFI